MLYRKKKYTVGNSIKSFTIVFEYQTFQQMFEEFQTNVSKAQTNF